MQQEARTEGGVRAVTRALDVLLAFRAGDDELPVAELLRRVALSRRVTDAVVDRHGRMVAAEARQLSAALGWHGPPFGR